MVIVHRRDIGRTPTGGRTSLNRGKRRFEIGDHPSATRVEKETKIFTKQTKSWRLIKARVHCTDHVNLYDPKSKSFVQAKVKSVVECPANRHFVRRNIMVKGAIVETEKGKAKVTSRPGQDGTVNAVLV
jgi:small subunit ribosomal protein S8e